MARDKSRDDKYFNCSQESEDNYVASLYDSKKVIVSIFLKDACVSNQIRYSTHMEVYELIKDELNLPIPA